MPSKNNKTKPFSERHPKLNLLLGFVILAILFGLGLLIVRFIFIKIGDFVIWMGAFTSNADAVIVVALITGSISIITVIVGKILERYFTNRKYLTEKREKPYCEFVSMVYKVMEKAKGDKEYTDEQMTKDMLKFSEQITLWGSPSVADKWIDFRMTGMTDTNPREMLYRLEDIMNCMRKDLGVRKLRRGKLLSFFVNDINSKK